METNISERSTPIPSGKHRQKKFGRGRPTASLIASVMTPVNRTEKRRPKLQLYISSKIQVAKNSIITL